MWFRTHSIMYLPMSCYWLILFYSYTSEPLSLTEITKLVYRAVSHVLKYVLVYGMLLSHVIIFLVFKNDAPDPLIHNTVDLTRHLHAQAHAPTRPASRVLHHRREGSSSQPRVRLLLVLVWATAFLIPSVPKCSNQHAWHIPAVSPNKATNANYGNI